VQGEEKKKTTEGGSEAEHGAGGGVGWNMGKAKNKGERNREKKEIYRRTKERRSGYVTLKHCQIRMNREGKNRGVRGLANIMVGRIPLTPTCERDTSAEGQGKRRKKKMG